MNKLSKMCRYIADGFRAGEYKVKISRSQVYTLFRLFTHPIDAFNDVKYERKGSLAIANILVALFFVEKMQDEYSKGYLFGNGVETPANIWMILATSVGLVLLWSICSWAMCTLFDGEGTFKEIWMMTSYSLLPFLIVEPFTILFTHILSMDEAIFVTVIHAIAVGWTLVLGFVGMIVCHQFTVTKTVLTCIVTVLCIFGLLFLGLLFFSISQQIVGFIKNISMEIFL